MTDPNIVPKLPSLRTKLLQIASEELTKAASSDNGYDNNGGFSTDILKLVDLNISSIPPELIELIKDKIAKLSLLNNSLNHLPNYFNRLSDLRYLDLHSNKFTEFPQLLCYFNRLETLDISKNYIKKLPLNIGNLVNLKVLSLKDNHLEYLPSSISDMHNLKILEVSENPLIQPSLGLIQELQNVHHDDWVDKLKVHVMENGLYLDSKIQETGTSNGEGIIERSRSNSSDYVSVKQAKRMGFIVNKKPVATLKFDEEEEEKKPSKQSHQAHQRISHQHSMSQPDLSKQNASPSTSLSTANSNINSRTRSQTVTLRNDSRSNTDLPSLMPPMEEIKEEFEHKSSAYFKRLSTLPEVKKPKDVIIIDVSRKFLYIFTQLHSNIHKITVFCANKKVSQRLNSSLSSLKQSIETFIEILEDLEVVEINRADLIDRLLQCIAVSLTLYKNIMKLLQDNMDVLFESIDISFIRSLYLNLFGSFMELYNASKIMYPNLMVTPAVTEPSPGPMRSYSVSGAIQQTQQQPLSSQTASSQPLQPSLRVDTAAALQVQGLSGVQSSLLPPTQVSDERLLESVYNATSAAQIVFSQLTNAINKTAWINVANNGQSPLQLQLLATSLSASGLTNPLASSETVTSKVKDLTSICVSAIDCTKSLKSSLHTVSTSMPQQQDKLRFYKDTNLFLKSIINILNTTKASINDLPILNELRPSLALLTKLTKDVTIMLENSTFKTVYVNMQQQQQQQQQQLQQQHLQQLQLQQLLQLQLSDDHMTPQTSLPQSSVLLHPPPLSSIPSMTAFPPFHQQQSLNVQQQQLTNIVASLPPITTPVIAALGNVQLQLVLSNGSGSGTNTTTGQPQSQQNPFEAMFDSVTKENAEEKVG